MADNFDTNAGTGGKTFASDQISTVDYPIAKLAHGALDSATLVSTSSGLPVQQQGTWTVTSTGPLTDTQLRATAVPVSGPLTDTQLRATAVPISAASLPLPSGAATEATLDARTGALTETAPATDTASSGINGRLQRIAQRLSSLIALVPTALGAHGGFVVEGVSSGTAIPVSLASAPSTAVTNAGTFAVQVTSAPSTAVTNAGTFATQATQAGTWTVQPGNTPNTSAWLTSDRPATSGGVSVSHLASAATTNATNVKASAGQLYGFSIANTNAAARYIAFHNSAGTPTAGASVVAKFLIPGATAGAGSNIFIPCGLAFATGIAYTTVTGAADSDSTGVGANDLIINIFYA